MGKSVWSIKIRIEIAYIASRNGTLSRVHENSYGDKTEIRIVFCNSELNLKDVFVLRHTKPSLEGS